MEQVEGGDLVVNRGDESRPKDTAESKRDLNALDGYDAALKLAQVCRQSTYLWLILTCCRRTSKS